MKVSTKGRYALRLMLDLAENSNGRPVRLKDIASRQEISEKYMEQIVSTLNKAGLVASVRGPQGGYILLREPKDYTVGEILRLTEGSISPVDCILHEGKVCKRTDICATKILWQKLDDAISGVIDNVTLQDLKDWQDDISNGCSYCE